MRRSSIKPSGDSKSRVLAIDMDELNDILARAEGALPEEDRAKLRASLETFAWMQQELTKKNVDIARLRSLFGMQTSEKTEKVLKGQDRDAELSPDGGAAGPGKVDEEVPVKPKRKAKGHGRRGADQYEGADRVKTSHESLASGDPCPECPTNKSGKVYTMAKPRVLVRVVGRAPLHATVYEQERLRCNLCGTIFTAAPPPGVGSRKYDATAASMIGLMKYGSGMPFNRLQGLQGNLRIPLPAATQWDIVQESAGDLTPVHDELIRRAAQARLMHNDDTSMKVLALREQIDKAQKSGTADSKRTGIFSTNIVSVLEDGHRIALYFTGRQHAGENINDVLAKRAAELDMPMQMCDGLGHNLPAEFKTLVGNCLAHARRKFVEVVNSFPDECRRVLETLRDVYVNDDTTRTRGMSDADRLSYHQEHSSPLMEDLRGWMDAQFEQKIVEPNSALGSAISYMTKRWDRLTLYLREPGAPLDNNISERALKKAILHRRNSLFYKTENGARVGDLFMALIHTAELADANPLDYLRALLENRDDVEREPGQWMPWNYRQRPAIAKPCSRLTADPPR